jgi:hypothetical protein
MSKDMGHEDLPRTFEHIIIIIIIIIIIMEMGRQKNSRGNHCTFNSTGNLQDLQ